MDRRKYLATLGVLTSGTAAAMGTGAFTSASATRDVSVSVADDTNGYLAIQKSGGPNDQFATVDANGNGEIGLDFSDSGNGGSGVGLGSVYNFDNVITVTNQGTQTIYVWATFTGSSFPHDGSNFWLYPNGNSSQKLRDSNDQVVGLSPGQSANIGVHIDTDVLSSTGTETPTMTLRADVTEPSSSNSVDSDGDEFLVVDQSGNGDETSIQDGIDAVTGSTVVVRPGTYREVVTIDKSVTLRAARGQPTIESPDGDGNTVVVDADGVTIQGFEIKNRVGSGGGFAYNQGLSVAGPISDLTIRDNVFRDVGSGTSAKGNSAPIAIQTKGDVLVENVDIVNNEVENVVGRQNPDSNFSNRYPKGIYVSSKPGGNTAGTIRDLDIRGNEIHNIEGPQSAHGIQLHDQVEDVEIIDNQIYDIRGDPDNSTDLGYTGDDWASAIQLSQTGGTVQGVVIEGNYLSAVSDDAIADSVSDDELDDKATPGFALEVSGAADPTTIDLRDNALVADGGIINKTGDGAVDAEENWWGHSSGPSSASADSNAPYGSAGGSAVADGSGALVVDFNEDGTAEVNFDNFLTASPVTSPTSST